MTCPGCYRPLRQAMAAFCPACAKSLFDGQRVTITLPFTAQELPDTWREEVIEIIRRISISGVQYKVSMLLTNG